MSYWGHDPVTGQYGPHSPGCNCIECGNQRRRNDWDEADRKKRNDEWFEEQETARRRRNSEWDSSRRSKGRMYRGAASASYSEGDTSTTGAGAGIALIVLGLFALGIVVVIVGWVLAGLFWMLDAAKLALWDKSFQAGRDLYSGVASLSMRGADLRSLSQGGLVAIWAFALVAIGILGARALLKGKFSWGAVGLFTLLGGLTAISERLPSTALYPIAVAFSVGAIAYGWLTLLAPRRKFAILVCTVLVLSLVSARVIQGFSTQARSVSSSVDHVRR